MMNLLTSATSIRQAAFVAMTSFALLQGGCGGSPDADASSEGSIVAKGARVSPGVFKLYSDPQYDPSPTCDVHTVLELANDDQGPIAKLHEGLLGYCEIHVEPNARTYRLELAHEECGSQIFHGSNRQMGVPFEIVVTDHRARRCENEVPAEIIVEETAAERRQYEPLVKYSNDRIPTGEQDFDTEFGPNER